MPDTEHLHAVAPVEGDGISYKGLLWFVVILVATTIFCELLVWGMLDLMQYEARRTEVARAPLAAPPAQPSIKDGALESGTEGPPQPNLLVSEPLVLSRFREQEEQQLTTYGIDRKTGTIHIPIDRAKALILQRGLPVRPGSPPAPPAVLSAAGRPAAEK
jgi:hypothetical protein